MKKLSLFFFLLTFLLFPSTSLAHVLLTDGSIGAVLHIDPDDDPIAGEQSTFIFNFKDKSNKLDLTTCTCEFQIFEGGKKIYSQGLSDEVTSPLIANITYTFSEKNIYTMKIVGKPAQDSKFQSFELSYDIRVSRDNANNNSQNLLPEKVLIVSILVIAVLCIGFLIFRRLKEVRK